jgi:glycosyltransferase involved in cell wall biosynthesis
MLNEASKEIIDFVSRPHFDEAIILKKDLSWPQISIVTPSFNHARFLERTILSVLNQNYPNLEYIIMDGGSTDGSVEIIRKYEKYIEKWISQKDHSQTEAINKGFLKTKGEFVGWQNSDDIYLPGVLKEVSLRIKKSPEAEIIFGNLFLIDENDRITGELRFPPFSVMTHFYEGMAIANQSSFWKRKLLRDIGMLDSKYQFCMDYEFFLRAGIRGVKFANIHAPIGAFRIHKGSKTSNVQSVREELAKIEAIYGKKVIMGKYIRILSLCRRLFYYLIQGDWDYLLKGFGNRLKLIN